MEESVSLDVRLLGPFDVARGGHPVAHDAWGRRKTLALAKLLIAHRGIVFPYDRLIEILYEEASSERGVSNLYRRISELRRALEPGLRDGRHSAYVCQQGQTYVFAQNAACTVDVETFRHTVSAARRLRDERRDVAAVKCYRDAIALYRGDFLEEDRYVEWTQAPRARYRETFLAALSQLAACHAQLGEYEQAIEACRTVLEVQPYREPVIRQLMEYYAVAGDRSQAIATYNEGVRTLADILDVQPEAETTQLFKKIAGQSGVAIRRRLDRRRIAVLPFHNVGKDDVNRFFVDGLTEEIIHILSNVPQFRVISQASAAKYALERMPLAQLGRELNVGSILEGSVRILDGQVRITASFSDVETEERLWSKTYDRKLSETLSIQSEIAGNVARALRHHVSDESSARLRETQTSSWDAYERFLIGRYHWNQRTPEGYRRAAKLFEEALAFDPDYSSAHAGLAAAWCDLGECSPNPDLRARYGRQAEAEARCALELHPRCAEARATLGRNRMYFGRDPLAGARELEEAIRLNPSYAMASNWLGVCLIGLARFDEAVDVLQTAHRHDPLSLAVIRNLGRAFYSARRYEEAIEQLWKALEIVPSFTGLHSVLGLVHLELGRYEDAIAEFETENLLDPRFASSRDALISIARARTGDPERLEALLRNPHVEPSEGVGASALIWLAVAFLEAGQEAQAIAQLRYSLERSLGWFMLYIHSPLLDAVTSKAWYVSLLKDAGLVSS